MTDRIQTSYPGMILAPIEKEDLETLVLHLNDLELYRNTLSIPHPYTMNDAINYFRQVRNFERKYGKRKEWSIRYNSRLIGGAGALMNYGPDSHKTEIGYWLASPYRGKGMMSAAVMALTRQLFSEWGFVRLEANVFSYNPASCRVLEKCGFEQEGVLKKFCKKDGEYLDTFLYSLLKSE